MATGRPASIIFLTVHRQARKKLAPGRTSPLVSEFFSRPRSLHLQDFQVINERALLFTPTWTPPVQSQLVGMDLGSQAIFHPGFNILSVSRTKKTSIAENINIICQFFL